MIPAAGKSFRSPRQDEREAACSRLGGHCRYLFLFSFEEEEESKAGEGDGWN